MKIAAHTAFLCCSILLLASCSANDAPPDAPLALTQPTAPEAESPNALSTAQPASIALPAQIDLPFTPLPLEPLEKGSPPSDWTKVRTIDFGVFQGKPVELNVYRQPAAQTDLLPPQLNAVLNWQNQIYRIRDVSSDLLADEAAGGTVAVNRGFPSGSQALYVLGGVNLFANGPDLRKYIVYNFHRNAWFSFDQWGNPLFLDLDGDGHDEFVLLFPGQHLQMPDASVVVYEDKQLQQSAGFADAISAITKWPATFTDFERRASVTLSQTSVPPAFDLNINSEQYIAPLASYRYDHGKLLKN